MNTREMPHDLGAEITLLGSVLINKQISKKIINELEPDDFYDPKHSLIFKAMKKLHNQEKPVDVVTITSLLDDHKKLAEAGSVEYLYELSQSVPTIAHTDYYIEMIKQKTKLRKIISTSLATAEKAFDVDQDNIDVFIDKAESEILSITRDIAKHEAKGISLVVNNVTERLLKMNNSDITGLSTGYKEFDKLTSGLNNGELIIIAARPSIGKTAFALNIAKNTSILSDKRCLIFSLEMPAEQLVQRLISSIGKINSNIIKNGDIFRQSKQSSDRYYAAAEKVAKSSILINDNSVLTMNEIIAEARKIHNDEKLDLIIIDYLQLISSKIKGDRNNQISDISRKLKILARELDIPVIVLSQLSRDVEKRQDKHPMLSDLRDSGAIEQDADVVTFLYRDSYYNKDDKSNVMDITETIVAKNRNGATGTMILAFEKHFSRFTDIAKEKEAA